MGSFELRRNGDRVTMPLSAQRVVAFVALEPRPVLRCYLAGVLWADASEDRAGASLRSALWRAQQSCPVLRASTCHVAVAPDVAIDVHQITARAHKLSVGEKLQPMDIDVLLSSGDLLEDWYDDWLAIERERFRQLRLHALEALCLQLTAAGRHAEAADAALAAIAAAPLRESAYRALIHVDLAEGNLYEARRHYEQFARRAAQHNGLTASPAMEGLISCSPP